VPTRTELEQEAGRKMVAAYEYIDFRKIYWRNVISIWGIDVVTKSKRDHWQHGTVVTRQPDQMQWAVCCYGPCRRSSDKYYLEDIGAWCGTPMHALAWSLRNFVPADNRLLLIRRAPFYSRIELLSWR